MKNIQQLTCILLSLFSISACQREKIVLEELPSEFQMVAHCYLDADSSKLISCKLTQSQAIFGQTNTELKPIIDATIEIGSNGNWLQLVYDDMNQIYLMNAPDGFLEDNQKYELKISHPNYPTATASINLLPDYTTDHIQAKVKILRNAIDSTQSLSYSISWEDQASNKNYYRIIPQIGYINIDMPGDTFYMAPSFGKIFLADESNIKGNLIEWNETSNFYPFSENGFKPVTVKIHILNIDRTYYDYHLFIQKMNSDGGFVEPSFFSSNMNQAYGIFAACNGLSEKTFPLE
ncbi:MAG: DUF4249 domain-containing protein [Bacteroidia bacterium]